VKVIVVEEGIMWILASVEGVEVAWLAMVWDVEGLIKSDFDFSTPIVITGLEEETPMIELADTMYEKYTTWKG
jgi:hypothetical protein